MSSFCTNTFIWYNLSTNIIYFCLDITSDSNIGHIIELAEHSDKRVQNLAVIFLEDYCDRDQVQRVRSGMIPLPPTPQPVHLPSVSQLPLSEQPHLATTPQ